MEIAAIFKLATVAIEMITQKDKNKGLNLALQHKELKEKWYEEFNKPENKRSGLKLDRIRRELLILADTIYTAAQLPSNNP